MRMMGHKYTFDFQFCLEFAMRTMGHQNTTFDLLRLVFTSDGVGVGVVVGVIRQLMT